MRVVLVHCHMIPPRFHCILDCQLSAGIPANLLYLCRAEHWLLLPGKYCLANLFWVRFDLADVGTWQHDFCNDIPNMRLRRNKGKFPPPLGQISCLSYQVLVRCLHFPHTVAWLHTWEINGDAVSLVVSLVGGGGNTRGNFQRTPALRQSLFFCLSPSRGWVQDTVSLPNRVRLCSLIWGIPWGVWHGLCRHISPQNHQLQGWKRLDAKRASRNRGWVCFAWTPLRLIFFPTALVPVFLTAIIHIFLLRTLT